MDEFTSICEEAAKSGGKVLLEWWGRVRPTEKGRHDLVTEADLNSQRVVAGIIQKAFPKHALVGEEELEISTGKPARADEYTWFIDPLDGTTNYIHGFPHFCVSVALVRRAPGAAELITGTIYDPSRDECFTASARGGALLNGTPLRTSNPTSLDQSLLVASLPAVIERDAVELQTMIRAIVSARSMRRTGSAALNLAYLAAGRLDGYWATSLNPWDVAAGALLVQEAGGVIRDFDGGPFDVFSPGLVTAATPELYAELFALLRES